MPLIGNAALLLAFDVEPGAVDEHDYWHTFEHLPERMGVPGFHRGTRWVAAAGSAPDVPRYVVVYEVADLSVLSGPAYRHRLDHPSAWTARMMPHYRGMRRGFCAVTGSVGAGVGAAARVQRFRPAPGRAEGLRSWLAGQVLPGVPGQRGAAGAHLLEGAAAPAMTQEQRLRGADAPVDWALVVVGHSAAEALRASPAAADLAMQGATGLEAGTYVLQSTLCRHEVPGPAA